MTYDEYINLAQAYMAKAQAADPAFQKWQNNAMQYSADMGGSPAWEGADYAQQWFDQLSPQQQAEYQQTRQAEFADRAQSFKGRLGTLASYIPAVVAAIGTAGAASGLLGGAAGAGEAVGSSLAASELGATAPLAFDTGVGGLFGSQAAIDSALASGATGLGSTAGIGGGALLGMGGVVAPALTEGIGSGLLSGSGLGSLAPALDSIAGSAPTPGSSLGSAATTAGGLLGSGGSTDIGGILSGLGSVKDWGSLLAGGAGLANSLRSPETAAPPDYTALAKLQAQLNQEAADKALAANRPDQVDAAGNTLTWTQDPVTGKWTQTQKLSSGNQALLDTSQQAQLDSLRGVANRGDFNFQGGSTMDPVGNSKEIQDAWMNLLKPQREMALNSEIQRLKNQGLTEDSPAFQRAMLRQNQADTDAQNKALIAGTSEYGNQFTRSLQGRQQAFGEYQTDYNAPMQQYQGLMGIAQPQGQFGSFTNAQNTGGAPVYNAGQDQYTANVTNANVKNAQNNNLTQGLFGLSGAIAKGGWGP